MDGTTYGSDAALLQGGVRTETAHISLKLFQVQVHVEHIVYCQSRSACKAALFA